MSNITADPIASKLGHTRLADSDDAPFILELINESISYTFRISQLSEIIYLIRNSVLSICQLDNSNQVVGFMALREYPMIPSVHPGAWEQYIWTKYKTTYLGPRNTLFIHLLCWHDEYGRDLIDAMLRSVFMHDQYVHYVCMVKTDMRYPVLKPGQGNAEASFREVLAMERGVKASEIAMLCVCNRKDVCPRMRIRRAVEEDNDDITPIVERHSERLRKLYGEFYVSELIARHPESNRILLVCEHNGTAVGVMCLNTVVNLEALEDSYDLTPFAGLRRVVDCNKMGKDTQRGSFSEPCPLHCHGLESSASMGNLTSLARSSALNINNLDEEYDDGMYGAPSYPYWASVTERDSNLVILDLFDDEEEVEFDIINIDPSHILPDLMTQEHLDRADEKQKHPHQHIRKTSEKKLSRISSLPKLVETTHRFAGEPNAFLLELFAIDPAYDERIGFDMLEVAFELFPNRDYCITCLPSCQSAFPLLEHFVYCTPLYSCMKFVKESLYVSHVNSVRGEVRVREGEAADLPYLKDVLEHTAKRESLMETFETSLLSPFINSYILLAENQPIGLVITKPLEDAITIRTHYDLTPVPQRPGTDGIIAAGVLSPVLEVHSRWYMREVMRQTCYSTLFWTCQLEAKGDTSRSLMSLVERMVPVRPRPAIPNITGYSELDHVYKENTKPFAVWMMERPLSALPKVNVNNNIVVVGASRTGLAFLESLIIGPSSKYLTFTNITLVSEHGLPIPSDCLKAASTCVPRDGRYTERYIKSVPFYQYIDIMAAVMVKIDRQKKCIHLKSGCVKPYDELVITCGHQFQHPEYLRESLDIVNELKKGRPCERILMDNPKYQPDRVPPPPEVPVNLMLINTLHQANHCLVKLLRMVDEEIYLLSENRPIVVYGECIEAYSCMAALLEVGIKPSNIVFVEPFPPEDAGALRVNCFNDEKMDELVQDKIERSGIRVLRRTRLVNWQVSNNRLTALRFMSYIHCVTQPCFALFYYGLKAIDLHAFKAINECGLVYDGGLIVGPTFETNDSAIFGAGTCVQYSRRLYATYNQQKYYNSEDIGESLAQIFLEKFDPFVMCNTKVESAIGAMLSCGDRPSIQWQPVMKFYSPVMTVATLPGPLYYMKLQKPTPDIPMEVQLSLPHQGHTLVTDHNENYFSLRLNVLHIVDAVTCVSHTPFSVDLLSQLYGRHEAFFNKLLLRYQLGQIVDLYKYFTMPWLAAVYQEAFEGLLTSIDLQDVSTVTHLLLPSVSIFDHYDKDRLQKSVANMQQDDPSLTCSMECSMQDNLKITTFRSLMANYISSRPLMQFKGPPTDIPKECGQNAAIHRDVAKFWEAVEGERIVNAHVANHLTGHSVANPHYAKPEPGFL